MQGPTDKFELSRMACLSVSTLYAFLTLLLLDYSMMFFQLVNHVDHKVHVIRASYRYRYRFWQ